MSYFDSNEFVKWFNLYLKDYLRFNYSPGI